MVNSVMLRWSILCTSAKVFQRGSHQLAITKGLLPTSSGLKLNSSTPSLTLHPFSCKSTSQNLRSKDGMGSSFSGLDGQKRGLHGRRGTKLLKVAAAATATDHQPVLNATNGGVEGGEPPLVRQELVWTTRTHTCGDLRELDVGTTVRLCGWVSSHRSHGGVAFVNLRDHTGIVQITTDPIRWPAIHGAAERLRSEYVVAVQGLVRKRPPEGVNPKMATGAIEIVAEHIQLLNAVRGSLPFPVTTAEAADETIKEETRLRS